jgi:hypothetical protein
LQFNGGHRGGDIEDRSGRRGDRQAVPLGLVLGRDWGSVARHASVRPAVGGRRHVDELRSVSEAAERDRGPMAQPYSWTACQKRSPFRSPRARHRAVQIDAAVNPPQGAGFDTPRSHVGRHAGRGELPRRDHAVLFRRHSQCATFVDKSARTAAAFRETRPRAGFRGRIRAAARSVDEVHTPDRPVRPKLTPSVQREPCRRPSPTARPS